MLLKLNLKSSNMAMVSSLFLYIYTEITKLQNAAQGFKFYMIFWCSYFIYITYTFHIHILKISIYLKPAQWLLNWICSISILWLFFTHTGQLPSAAQGLKLVSPFDHFSSTLGDYPVELKMRNSYDLLVKFHTHWEICLCISRFLLIVLIPVWLLKLNLKLYYD